MDDDNRTNRRIDVIDLREDAPPVHKRHRNMRQLRAERREAHKSGLASWHETEEWEYDDDTETMPIQVDPEDVKKVNSARLALMAGATKDPGPQSHPYSSHGYIVMTNDSDRDQIRHEINTQVKQRMEQKRYLSRVALEGGMAATSDRHRQDQEHLNLIRSARESNLVALGKTRQLLGMEGLTSEVQRWAQQAIISMELVEEEFASRVAALEAHNG